MPPGKGTLQSAIDAAREGDSLLLGAGTYSGSVDVHRSLVLSGSEDGASIVDGEGSSHVIRVSASDVTIERLNIRHSGEVAEDEDSGIFVTADADRALIQGNHLQDNLIGYVETDWYSWPDWRGSGSCTYPDGFPIVGGEVATCNEHLREDSGTDVVIYWEVGMPTPNKDW